MIEAVYLKYYELHDLLRHERNPDLRRKYERRRLMLHVVNIGGDDYQLDEAGLDMGNVTCSSNAAQNCIARICGLCTKDLK